jgi:hypothetical protein
LRASISTESSDASSSVTLPTAKAFQSADYNFGNSTRGDASTARVSAKAMEEAFGRERVRASKDRSPNG